MTPTPFTARADLGFAWSVKDSFLQYIRGMHDGDISWRDGAAVTDAGQFYFPLTQVRGVDGTTELGFRGEVRFTAHRGLLSVSIKDPVIRITHDRAELAVRVGDAEEHIAELDLPARIIDNDVAMWLDARSKLAGSGPEMFGGTYPDGEPLAPLTIRIPEAAAPVR
ncbi:HtaA domain-containing protein [Leifsonia virtsii]|uniref:HtaA domain-containing protein n=1 Tax=Leifsonia virtsii TaxID=3035915 RepID=A0ABT8IXD5_9MICO|nr:HtaA domain-containing protein [Leifsonia virtsii]MDN4596684.1 HtaA domain-containing protein [Leifsonia virtsii]